MRQRPHRTVFTNTDKIPLLTSEAFKKCAEEKIHQEEKNGFGDDLGTCRFFYAYDTDVLHHRFLLR